MPLKASQPVRPHVPPDDPDDEAPDLDIHHLADLANLPLDDDEAAAMVEACQEVLEAFGLPEVEGELPEARTVATFEDEVEACQPATVDAIVDAFPRRDGRHLIP